MTRILLAGAMGLLLLALNPSPPAHAAGPGTVANWSSHSGGTDESGYSRLQDINTGDIGRLGLAWSLDLADERTLEATPLAVDGVLYFTGSYSKVYAVDAVSGKLLWSYDPEIWNHYPAKMKYVLGVNRGTAYADGRVFVCTLDGRLIALDAKTGRVLWTVETLGGERVSTSTGAPITFKDKVIIGNGGADYGERGYVTAYDAATGKQAWRFYTAPGSPDENKGDPAMERAAKTWGGEYWKVGTGGTVWNGITFDPELNRVYIGTGNSGPYDPAVRSPGGGDNLYLASMVALDADTGKYIWHYQVNPREAWDYKATANMIATTLAIDGKPRKVLLQAPTNGFFYVIDRETGQFISAEKIGKVTWAERIDPVTGRPVEAKNIRYENGETLMWPGPVGAHNWQDMSFSPKTELAYIPYMQLGGRFSKVATAPGVPFGGVVMKAVETDPEDGKGALLAWDPVRQKARWKVPQPHMWNGGTLATAGNLVFQGTADGHFSAYDATTGKRLWRFNAGLGIISAPITYSVQGKQYVSVLVGYGASNMMGGDIMNIGWKYGAQPRRLETFVLDGKAMLPPTLPPDMTVRPVDDPSIKIDAADGEAGRMVFNGNCAACHGLDVVSAGAPAPDLRESQIAVRREDLWNVLHEGALLPRGMPRFDALSEAQVRQIHAFIRTAARKALGQGKSDLPKEGAGAPHS